MSRGGFSKIELLAVLTVLGLLAALLLPAIQQSRSSMRLVECRNNLHEMGVAFASYESVHHEFPAGYNGANASIHLVLLPYLGQQSLYDRFDRNGDSDTEHEKVEGFVVPQFICPSDPQAVLSPSFDRMVGTNYAGNTGAGVQNYGWNGLFGMPRHGPLRVQEVTDGLSNTASMAEILPGDGSGHLLRTNWNVPQTLNGNGQLEEFAEYCDSVTVPAVPAGGEMWLRGRPWSYADQGYTLYNHVLTPNKKSCYNGGDVPRGAYTAASLHSDGVNVLFADGRVVFVTTQVDRGIWRAYGSRDGGESASVN